MLHESILTPVRESVVEAGLLDSPSLPCWGPLAGKAFLSMDVPIAGHPERSGSRSDVKIACHPERSGSRSDQRSRRTCICFSAMLGMNSLRHVTRIHNRVVRPLLYRDNNSHRPVLDSPTG